MFRKHLPSVRIRAASHPPGRASIQNPGRSLCAGQGPVWRKWQLSGKLDLTAFELMVSVRSPWESGPPLTCGPAFLPTQCARDVVRLLLSHKANPNMLWSGHSPLSLSIASGNDLVSTLHTP